MRRIFLAVAAGAWSAAGCALGGAALPDAKATQPEARWSYLCFEAATVDEVQLKANAAGAQGWEMSSAASGQGAKTVWCFRQRSR
jgi:hypothetical protein